MVKQRLEYMDDDDYEQMKAIELAGAVPVESVGMYAIPGRMSALLLRCPGFEHKGVPEGMGVDCQFALNLLYGERDSLAIYVISWEAFKVERRLSFDLKTTVRRFFLGLVDEFDGRLLVTAAPRGTVPRADQLLALEIPYKSEVWRETAELAARIELAS